MQEIQLEKKDKNNNSYSASDAWSKDYAKEGMAYPAEYVIRILRGDYPNLNLKKDIKKGQKILDVGCGDGRHMPLFTNVGLDPHGVEISDSIVNILKKRLSPKFIKSNNLKTGSCANLPFEDKKFDYVIAWNSAYYMTLDNTIFEKHAEELARVTKPGGRILISVPKSTAFIFSNSTEHSNPDYRVIGDDPWGSMRNGEIMRCFKSGDELAESFKDYCKDFIHGDIHDNCFGLNYHWFLLVATRI